MNDYWYDKLRSRPEELFAKYLNYLLQRGLRDDLEVFTHKAIIRYLLSVSEHAESALSILNDVFAAESAGSKGDEVRALSRQEVLLHCTEASPTQLRRIAIQLLSKISEGRPLLFLLDNLDQKTSAWLEARGLHGAIRAFSDLAGEFQTSRGIIAMRDGTLASQEWLNIAFDLLKGWKHVFLLPPDLLTVLKKRCSAWHQRGTRIGGSGYRESMVVVHWVSEMGRPRSRSDKDIRSHDLLEIIEHRHPFNVREQLRDFARCCENVLLHKEWMKGKGTKADSIPWSEKSYEFFVRVFLLGEYRFFSEGLCGYPNIYDNDYPSSRFNACVRSWVIWYFRKNEVIEAPELITFLSEAGVPKNEVMSAVDSLKRYRILLPLPKDERLVLSIWGDYFRSAIAYDLPYIATIWWTTSMLEDYALGEAREPLASELREYGAKFLRWLDCEEKTAFAGVQKHAEKVHKIYDDTSYNVSYSLRRIEHALA